MSSKSFVERLEEKKAQKDHERFLWVLNRKYPERCSWERPRLKVITGGRKDGHGTIET